MTHLRTRAVHAGQHPDPTTGAIATPISQTTAFGYGTLERGAAIFAGEAPGYRYSRFANPTVAALEAKMADLEGAAAAVAFASGTAASSSVLLGLLNPGDELVFLGPLYGGTEGLLRNLGERWGITVVDATTRGLQACLTPATRMVWVETLTNPTLRLHDLAQVAAVARAHGAITVADNTFCTPCLVRPLELGIDLVLHSMTKYLGGHGDATGGLVAGSEALVGAVRKTGLGHVGGNLSPQEAFLFLRGIKTLPLRMAAHCEGAAAVAHYLATHPAVHAVHYPGLPGHPARAGAAPVAGRVWRHGVVRAGTQRARRRRAGAQPPGAVHPGRVPGRCGQPGLPPGQHHAQLCLARGPGRQWRDRGADPPERGD